MTIFVNFLKKFQVFGNFLTVKWQFYGGSARNPLSPLQMHIPTLPIKSPLTVRRRKEKSEVLTSSPYKRKLIESSPVVRKTSSKNNENKKKKSDSSTFKPSKIILVPGTAFYVGNAL